MQQGFIRGLKKISMFPHKLTSRMNEVKLVVVGHLYHSKAIHSTTHLVYHNRYSWTIQEMKEVVLQ